MVGTHTQSTQLDNPVPRTQLNGEIRVNLVDVFTATSYTNADAHTERNRQLNPHPTTTGKDTPSTLEHRADSSKIQKAVDDINQKLQHEDREVVFDYDPKINRVWLNVIDKNTGQVLDEMPPKIIRQMIESLGDIKGLVIDKQS